VTKTRKIIGALAGLAVVALVLAGCSTGGATKAQSVDQQSSADALAQVQQAQPTPAFSWSQLRQNLIEIETAQANTVQTTSFFYNQGVQTPIFTCPSIGYAIPATYQLTNPDQVQLHQGDRNGGNVVISQNEVTGVYMGQTSGTHVICVDANGQGYDNYWEGFVQTVTGPAHWDAAKGQVVLDGAPTAAFSTSH
jgi:hypothetical protein